MGEAANAVEQKINSGSWGLARAREVAREVEGSRVAVRRLVAAMFGSTPELRKRAADVARRVTERSAEPLAAYAEELAGLLAEVPPDEARTRWHLGLVVARIAHTREQRLRAGRLMELLAQDESNVVRCSALEGIARLACAEPELREGAQAMVERALHNGTKAERCRARDAKRRLERVGAFRVEL